MAYPAVADGKGTGRRASKRPWRSRPDALSRIRPTGKLPHGRNSNPVSLIRSGVLAEYRVRGRGIFVSRPVRPTDRRKLHDRALGQHLAGRNHPTTMFERFTERARQVVVLAQEEARTLKHNYIGTEHILLGLLREEEGLAARVLESLDITVERVRAQVVRIVGSGEEVTSGQIPFTPRAKKVLELALREALSLGHNSIGTEHVLLGLVRENESVAARILLDFPADAVKLREEIIRIGGAGPRQTHEGFPPGKDLGIELRLRRVVPVAQQMSDGTWVVS